MNTYGKIHFAKKSAFFGKIPDFLCFFYYVCMFGYVPVLFQKVEKSRKKS